MQCLKRTGQSSLLIYSNKKNSQFMARLYHRSVLSPCKPSRSISKPHSRLTSTASINNGGTTGTGTPLGSFCSFSTASTTSCDRSTGWTNPYSLNGHVVCSSDSSPACSVPASNLDLTRS